MMDEEKIRYLVSRLRRVVELLKSGEVHMAIAKLNADISALSTLEQPNEKWGGPAPSVIKGQNTGGRDA